MKVPIDIMRFIYLIAVFVLVVSEIDCHLVNNRTKSVEEHTTVTNEDGTVRYYSDKESKSRVDPKTVTTGETHVYLEDVFFKLKNQNWTKDEEPCLNRTLLMLKGLQNFSLWAVWQWDSISSEPMGLLFGNRYQLGNFDECLSAPWFESHPELRTQYCLANIKLERTDKAVKRRINEPYDPYLSALDYIQEQPNNTRPLNELTWGICVPEVCSSSTVERLLGVMLARSHLGTAGILPRINLDGPCQKAEKKQFDGLFYSFLIVIGIFTAITVVCTYINSKVENVDTMKKEIIQAFCLKYNALDLLRMKKEGIEVLYGIRYLTICFIVMDHQVGMSNPIAITNGREVDRISMSILGMFIVHDDLFVDTFFMLSGFLAANNLMIYKKFPNPIIIILKRYVRLIVAFALAVYYASAVFPYTGSGPLWPAITEMETGACRKNWWLNLLMLSNYFDSQNICLVVTWYIPCDFHFFVISVLLFWLYKRMPKVSLTCGALIAAASVIVPGVIVYVNQLPAVQLFNYEFASNPRASVQFEKTYIKSHTRAGAYIVGFIAGCIFATYKATGNLKRISQLWSIIGTVTGMVVMAIVMLTGSVFLWSDVGPFTSAIYAAVNRPVWAGGLALMVLCCALGYVPFLKSFLSMFIWVPLSRLAYGLYLSHTLFLMRSIFVTRNAERFDFFENLNASIGLIFFGTIASAVVWLIAEGPINNLLTLLLKPRNVRPKPDQNSAIEPDQNTSNVSVTIESNGHLHENLPTTIRLSSKF